MVLVTLNKLNLLLLMNLFLLVQLHLKLISELTLIDLTLTALHLLLHLLLLLLSITTERRRKTHLMRELIFKGAKEGGLLGGGHGGRLQPSIRAGHDRGRTGGVGGTAAPTAAGSTPSGTAS